MKQQSILIYLYAVSMAIEGTRAECLWHVIHVALYLQERDTPNAIVMYNLWKEHRLIMDKYI